MSLLEIRSLISQLPRADQEELLRDLACDLRAATLPATPRTPVIDRAAWVQKLEQLQFLTASKSLRDSQEILDELRADRI